MNIVIIDDSRIMLEIAREMLEESDLKVNIIPFINPIKAYDRIEKKDIEIVITDLIMPKMEGTDVIRKIKNNINLKHIKILMLTSITDHAKLAECFELGASDYITKPFDEYELIARVKNVIREINLQKKLAARLDDIERQHNKLLEANNKLKVTQSQLVQKEQMAGIGQLAAGVAHEINNPLGYIISNFSTLSEYMEFISELMNKYDELNLTNEEIHKFKQLNDYEFVLEDIEELITDTKNGLSRVKEIIKSLRNFSRIDFAKEFADYDVNEGIKESLIISKNEYKYVANIETELNDIPMIKAHGGQINQVVLNMIINAVHAIKETSKDIDKGEKGLIKIKTEELNDSVVIEISDNGIGMNDDVKAKIFNPFFTTKEVGVGTGLGLSISYDIIENKHNGKISLESEPEMGTTFSIELPIKQQ